MARTCNCGLPLKNFEPHVLNDRNIPLCCYECGSREVSASRRVKASAWTSQPEKREEVEADA